MNLTKKHPVAFSGNPRLDPFAGLKKPVLKTTQKNPLGMAYCPKILEVPS